MENQRSLLVARPLLREVAEAGSLSTGVSSWWSRCAAAADPALPVFTSSSRSATVANSCCERTLRDSVLRLLQAPRSLQAPPSPRDRPDSGPRTAGLRPWPQLVTENLHSASCRIPWASVMEAGLWPTKRESQIGSNCGCLGNRTLREFELLLQPGNSPYKACEAKLEGTGRHGRGGGPYKSHLCLVSTPELSWSVIQLSGYRHLMKFWNRFLEP